MSVVELNVDLGEKPGEPAELYTLATTVNVACGGHAGDLASMARAVSFALTRGVKLAAHPSYPDRENFGRVSVAIDPNELAVAIDAQLAALRDVAVKLGSNVVAMKPHGALYHDAAKDPALAAAVIDGATRALGAEITIVGPPDGALRDLARARGLRYLREGFADRGYDGDRLIPRSEPGALLTKEIDCTQQALALASSGRVETICVHSDTPNAVAIARAVRDALLSSGLLAGMV